MNRILIIIVGLVFGLSCREQESVFTIVNIGKLDRVGIAQQLQIINKYSPKVVALDFMLTTDSLDKDKLLAKELLKVKSLVQSTILHRYIEPLNRWDSLETFHSKFAVSTRGFSNITVTDSVLVQELPMVQYYRN